MLTALLRIWTWNTDSISYNDKLLCHETGVQDLQTAKEEKSKVGQPERKETNKLECNNDTVNSQYHKYLEYGY